jgi:uncharacterized protein YeaO (DUF488 family)
VAENSEKLEGSVCAKIRLKLAYDPPSPKDGARILVERFWPRDLDEKHARLRLLEVAPSVELRREFGHHPAQERWAQFQQLDCQGIPASRCREREARETGLHHSVGRIMPTTRPARG